MEIRLFAPLTDELVKKFYGHFRLLVSSEEGATPENLMRVKQFERALTHRDIDANYVACTILDSDELGSTMAAARECYRDRIPSMTSLELSAYYIRLTLCGYNYFAEPFITWMEKSGIPYTPPEAIRTAQADLTEFGEITEEIALRRLENAAASECVGQGDKPRHAFARPDAEHDPSLHSTLTAHSAKGKLPRRFHSNIGG